jgi:hypothetical protein
MSRHNVRAWKWGWILLDDRGDTFYDHDDDLIVAEQVAVMDNEGSVHLVRTAEDTTAVCGLRLRCEIRISSEEIVPDLPVCQNCVRAIRHNSRRPK